MPVEVTRPDTNEQTTMQTTMQWLNLGVMVCCKVMRQKSVKGPLCSTAMQTT